MTYIYLVEIESNKVYVGKTKNPTKRVSDHRKTYGGHITYTIIDEINSIKKEDWTPLEKYWIEQFRQWGFEIVNPNPNGGGGSSEWKEESKIKQSQKYKGRKAPWAAGMPKDFTYTEEQKQKMRKPRVNKWNRNKMLSDIQSNEIKHKYDQGYRICDLSKEYNVSWGTIKNTLHR
jgi:hypothetical protein